MKLKNKYQYRSRISEKKFREIIKYFVLDFTASDIAKLSKINRNTVNRILNLLRERILEESEKEIFKEGVFELDESYFGARRVRGKRGRGASGKTPVFGLLKRNGKVYTKIVENCSKAELMPIIKGKILEGSTINTDGWKAYNGLILNGYKHYRVFHSHNEFARGKCHVNGIESFWSYVKRRLNKFNGTKKNFELFLKESEFRFNYKNENLYDIILKMLKENPLKNSLN